MATCKQCREFERCKDDAFINGARFDPNESAKYCTGFESITNGDRIRAMSDEELAKEMRSHAFALAACSERAWLEWLKQPAE